eukprot:3716078-Alexandrium_andersonii.AAC.1
MQQTQFGSLFRLKMHYAVLGGVRRFQALSSGACRRFPGVVRSSSPGAPTTPPQPPKQRLQANKYCQRMCSNAQTRFG